MKTFALRFGDTFSPKCGTIQAHNELIERLGFVWYGKLGSPISDAKIASIKQETDKILLIHSGKPDRWWAHFCEISKSTPVEGIPDYYVGDADKFKTWFKIVKFEPAPRDIMSKCIVISSQSSLSEASMYSSNPFFYIEYFEKE